MQDRPIKPAPRESYTDLLIIGAGPAGMMAAAWANQYPITTRIIDKNHERISKGQADGLQARTLEIFDSFGVADGVWKKGFHDIEVCTWASRLPHLCQSRVLTPSVDLSGQPRHTKIWKSFDSEDRHQQIFFHLHQSSHDRTDLGRPSQRPR